MTSYCIYLFFATKQLINCPKELSALRSHIATRGPSSGIKWCLPGRVLGSDFSAEQLTKARTQESNCLISNPAPSLTSCATLSKLLKLSGSHLEETGIKKEDLLIQLWCAHIQWVVILGSELRLTSNYFCIYFILSCSKKQIIKQISNPMR